MAHRGRPNAPFRTGDSTSSGCDGRAPEGPRALVSPRPPSSPTGRREHTGAIRRDMFVLTAGMLGADDNPQGCSLSGAARRNSHMPTGSVGLGPHEPRRSGRRRNCPTAPRMVEAWRACTAAAPPNVAIHCDHDRSDGDRASLVRGRALPRAPISKERSHRADLICGGFRSRRACVTAGSSPSDLA